MHLTQGVASLGLIHLEAQGNPLKEPPLEVCLKGLPSIREWFGKEENAMGSAANVAANSIAGPRASAALTNRLFGAYGRKKKGD